MSYLSAALVFVWINTLVAGGSPHTHTKTPCEFFFNLTDVQMDDKSQGKPAYIVIIRFWATMSHRNSLHLSIDCTNLHRRDGTPFFYFSWGHT